MKKTVIVFSYCSSFTYSCYSITCVIQCYVNEITVDENETHGLPDCVVFISQRKFLTLLIVVDENLHESSKLLVWVASTKDDGETCNKGR